MFSSEKELVNCIESYISTAPDFIRGERRFVFTELGLGYGIADVVAVGYSETPSTTRKNFLAYFDISLLSLIEKEESISFDDIVYITKSPTKKITSALSSLINEEFVVFREGKYISHRKYADLLTDSIAIEAKLKDWRRALKQAYRYKWFANKSYVFLPKENITMPEKNLDLFRSYNVGLASVSREDGLEVLFAPKDEPPVSDRMRIALNEHLLQNDTATWGF
ncbi:MAG: hypothetical protein HY505_00600 [Candidatus Yanofskybacteria bacterium]|nr:hypothetical protein [Candidatus Yanofskybacteria bacterium]